MKTRLLRYLPLLIVTLCGFVGTGCNTLTKGTKAPVFIDSKPQGAKVIMGGKVIGTTPTAASLPKRKSSIPLVMELSGYKTWSGELVRKPDGNVVTWGNAGNVAATFLSPPFGLAGFGIDWFTKANHNFPNLMITLEPELGYRGNVSSTIHQGSSSVMTRESQHQHVVLPDVYVPTVTPGRILIQAERNPVRIIVVGDGP